MPRRTRIHIDGLLLCRRHVELNPVRALPRTRRRGASIYLDEIEVLDAREL